MAVQIKVQIDGLNKIMEGLKRAPETTIEETSKAINKSVNLIWNQALKEAPVNKQTGGGNLRQNIRGRMTTKMSGEVEARAPYSIFVHEGTSPHDIEVRNKQVLANKRTGQFFGKLVHHPGTRPNPFFTRAINNCRTKINEFFKTAIDNIFKSLQ